MSERLVSDDTSEACLTSVNYGMKHGTNRCSIFSIRKKEEEKLKIVTDMEQTNKETFYKSLVA
jgi:hypothetical protein